MKTNSLPSRARPRAAGFSLIEVVIAMGILAFGLLTLALLQIHALTQGATGRHTLDASIIGRSHLEQVDRLPWATLTAATGAGWQAAGWAGAPPVNVTVNTAGGGTLVEHAYTVDWRVTAVGALACLRDVELRVRWNEEDFTNQRQSILATRRYNSGGTGC